MLKIILQQYNVMQNTSAILTTIFGVNSQKPITKNKAQKKAKE